MPVCPDGWYHALTERANDSLHDSVAPVIQGFLLSKWTLVFWIYRNRAVVVTVAVVVSGLLVMIRSEGSKGKDGLSVEVIERLKQEEDGKA